MKRKCKIEKNASRPSSSPYFRALSSQVWEAAVCPISVSSVSFKTKTEETLISLSVCSDHQSFQLGKQKNLVSQKQFGGAGVLKDYSTPEYQLLFLCRRNLNSLITATGNKTWCHGFWIHPKSKQNQKVTWHTSECFSSFNDRIQSSVIWWFQLKCTLGVVVDFAPSALCQQPSCNFWLLKIKESDFLTQVFSVCSDDSRKKIYVHLRPKHHFDASKGQ